MWYLNKKKKLLEVNGLSPICESQQFFKSSGMAMEADAFKVIQQPGVSHSEKASKISGRARPL